jgi:glutaconate CoA-transferase subunit A
MSANIREGSSMRKSSNKVVSLKEAIRTYVHDGDSVAFGGMGGQQCVASAHEIARQGRKDLTLIGDSPCEPADVLIGAGLIRKIEVAWAGYAVAGIGANYRRAIEEGVPSYIQVDEISNYTMGLRFFAGAIGVPFMPTKSLLGSDILKYNPNVKIIDCPYSGEIVALVPATHPDVAFIHVYRSDALGNAQLFCWSSNAENIARAARRTIVTCEEIVSTEEVRKFSTNTIIPQFCVDAVVELPYGSHPWNMPYCYAYDIPFHMEMMANFRTRDGFLEWLDEWVYGCKDHADYCRKVGWERLLELTRIERKFTRIG